MSNTPSMIFLPIVERELRVAARRHSTYWVRLLVATIAIAIGFFFYIAHTRAPQELVAQRIFGGLSVLALIYGLASGRRSTADCLSEEKREGTLGLLFLTDLKGYDVVLGKLAATSVNALYGLLAIFPVLAVPLMMGGITNGEFWRMLLVLVNTFVFSLAVGVLASALSRGPREAFGANLLLLVLLAVIPPGCAGGIAYFTPTHFWVHELMFSCPVYSFYLAPDAQYKWHMAHFWWSVGITHGLTWLLVALASRRIPHSWQEEPARADKRSPRAGWQVWVYGTPEQRQALRRRLLPRNAYCWLASRARLKCAGVWVFLGFVAAWWLFLVWVMDAKWLDESLSVITALLINCVLKLWIAIEAGQRLAEDQKQGALELLLSTPLSARKIMRGQLLALRRQFLGPLLVVIGAEVAFTIMLSRRQYQADSQALAMGMTGIFLLLADILTLVGVAMSRALTARSPNHASISTMTRVLILPWVVFAIVAVMANLWWPGISQSETSWKFYQYLWFWLGLLTDFGFGLHAWWQLRTRFRELALHKFNPPAARGTGGVLDDTENLGVGQSSAALARIANPSN